MQGHSRKREHSGPTDLTPLLLHKCKFIALSLSLCMKAIPFGSFVCHKAGVTSFCPHTKHLMGIEVMMISSYRG